MGQSPAQLEIDIQRRRNALETRVSRLERRVRDDVHSAQDWRTGRVDELKSSVKDMESEAVDKAKGVVMTEAGSETAVAQHPGALVTASVVGGFLLGLKSGGEDNHAHGNGRSKDGNSDKASKLPGGGGILGLFSETVRGVVGLQTGALVETALDAGTSGLKSAVSEITGIGSKAKESESAAPGDNPREVDAKSEPRARETGGGAYLREAVTSGR